MEKSLNPHMDLQKYRKLSDIEFNNLADVARKVIGMIKEQEDLWKFKRVSVPRERWEELAVNYFLPICLTKFTSEKFRELPKKSFSLYRHMSFYRAVTQDYEVELRKSEQFSLRVVTSYEEVQFDRNTLKELREHADVECDEGGRIIKYSARDGSPLTTQSL